MLLVGDSEVSPHGGRRERRLRLAEALLPGRERLKELDQSWIVSRISSLLRWPQRTAND